MKQKIMKCPYCKGMMVTQTGRRGKFYRCQECTRTINLYYLNNKSRKLQLV